MGVLDTMAFDLERWARQFMAAPWKEEPMKRTHKDTPGTMRKRKRRQPKKTNRRIWRVLPWFSSRREHIGWLVTLDGDEVTWTNTKREAVKLARTRARRDWYEDGILGQLVVHRLKGRSFEYEHTYGADPKRSKG
jgi:hypothetical protein